MTAGFGLPGVVFKGSLADNILLIKKFGFCLEKKLSTTITEVYQWRLTTTSLCCLLR